MERNETLAWPFLWADLRCLEADSLLKNLVPELAVQTCHVPLSSWFIRFVPTASPEFGAIVSSLCLLPKQGREAAFFRVYSALLEQLSPWQGHLFDCLRVQIGRYKGAEPSPASTLEDPWLGRVFWTLGACQLGREPSNFLGFGVAFTEAIRGLLSLSSYLTVGAQELTKSDGDSLIATLGADINPALAYALAGSPLNPDRAREVGAVLGMPEVREGCAARLAAQRRALKAACPEGIELGWLLEELSGAGERLLSVASTLNLMSSLEGLSPSRGDELRVALRKGVAALMRPEVVLLSHERQCFGMATARGSELEASFFPRGTVEAALGAARGQRGESILEVLLANPPGCLRYFPGWRGIPPDSDSLGLALRLGATLKGEGGVDEARGRLEEWITYIAPNLDESGVFPLWLTQGPEGSTIDSPPIPWAGNDCTASRLSLVLGLLMYGGRRFEGLVIKNLAWALGRLEWDRLGGACLGGSYYYHRRYGESLLLSVLKRMDDLGMVLSGGEDPNALGEALAERWMEAQGVDGSLGSPMETAWAVLGAGPFLGARWDEALWRAGRFLMESQGSSGLWAWEPAWRTLGKLGQGLWHGGEALSSAPCVEALSYLEGRLL